MAADLVSPFDRIPNATDLSGGAGTSMQTRAVYEGEVVIYISEIVSSRWKNSQSDEYYPHAFLDYALRQQISISEADTFESSVVWYAPDHGYATLAENNVEVTGAVYDKDSALAFSYPPSSYPFYSHASSAGARAVPGIPGSNLATESSTHTVVVEEATGTSCVFCPATTEALKQIQDLGTYNFYYVSLVGDKSSELQDSLALRRLANEYNFYGYPTCYFDGGYEVLLGGQSGLSYYTSRILTSGSRVTTGLIMELSVDWLEPLTIEVHVKIYQGDPSNQPPDVPSAPDGDAYFVTNRNYTCSVTGSDPNDDDLMYKWSIDGFETDWEGPYASGSEVDKVHRFLSPGTYDIAVRTKDVFDVESPWSAALTVEISLCGDAEQSGNVDIDDVVYLIAYIFAGGAQPQPEEGGDANCIGGVDIDDPVYLIAYIFGGGPSPCYGCP